MFCGRQNGASCRSRPPEVLAALVAQLVPGPIQYLRSNVEVLLLGDRHGGDGEGLLAALPTGVVAGELDIERAGFRLRVDRRFRDGELPVGAAGGEGESDGEEGEDFEHHGGKYSRLLARVWPKARENTMTFL